MASLRIVNGIHANELVFTQTHAPEMDLCVCVCAWRSTNHSHSWNGTHGFSSYPCALCIHISSSPAATYIYSASNCMKRKSRRRKNANNKTLHYYYHFSSILRYIYVRAMCIQYYYCKVHNHIHIEFSNQHRHLCFAFIHCVCVCHVSFSSRIFSLRWYVINFLRVEQTQMAHETSNNKKSKRKRKRQKEEKRWDRFMYAFTRRRRLPSVRTRAYQCNTNIYRYTYSYPECLFGSSFGWLSEWDMYCTMTTTTTAAVHVDAFNGETNTHGTFSKVILCVVYYWTWQVGS